jgi:hypothetical protein
MRLTCRLLLGFLGGAQWPELDAEAFACMVHRAIRAAGADSNAPLRRHTCDTAVLFIGSAKRPLRFRKYVLRCIRAANRQP